MHVVVQRRNVHQNRFRNRFSADTGAIYLLSEPENLGNATGIYAEVVRNRVQMSVLVSDVPFKLELIPYLRKRK